MLAGTEPENWHTDAFSFNWSDDFFCLLPFDPALMDFEEGPVRYDTINSSDYTLASPTMAPYMTESGMEIH